MEWPIIRIEIAAANEIGLVCNLQIAFLMGIGDNLKVIMSPSMIIRSIKPNPNSGIMVDLHSAAEKWKMATAAATGFSQ